MSETHPDPFLGRTVGGYRIDSLIGTGGMGTVYRATQLSLRRTVAFKVLGPELASKPQFLERFLREADILSRLAHPNIVTIIDRGEVDGRPYLAMEYVEGPSLREVMREGPLTAPEALRIVSSVLSALIHAHERGIVHRDIKPENVLLAQGGVVKVADFGLSRMLGPEDTTRLTRTQLVLGTYEYMAPEQREHAREADARSDLYATGVVLYEMLTGELPIGRFTLPSRRRPRECDARIDRVIERSLEKHPEDRFQRASEMADAVSSILETSPPATASRVPPPVSYAAARFEYHIDNVATIDYVLGTICHILGFLALFGAGFRQVLWTGMPFVFFFLFGWYLRDTAAGLRKYRRGARTAQAVIAIGGALTGILAPFSLYALWALFGHRGRTYYEARSRGLEEREAAQYTFRLLEEPYGPGKPAEAPPPTAPRPSQIPVQSLVTSTVKEPAVHRQRRYSGFVVAGSLLLLLTGVGLVLAGTVGFGIATRVLAPPVLVSGGLLIVGFFHALLTPGVRGAVAALFGLLLIAAAFAFLH